MTAQIGWDDLGPDPAPHPELLRQITGIEPERGGIHVLLDEHAGVRSAQRLALTDVGGSILVALWPAELKPQAEYLYRNGRAVTMIRAARARGWAVEASPHIAFFTASPPQRMYMQPEIDAEAYARRWEADDRAWIRQYTKEEVREELWPWLVDRGYASPADKPVLEEFLKILGRRPAHLRPALRFKKRWSGHARNNRQLAAEVRDDVNAILAAAGEPRLPAPQAA